MDDATRPIGAVPGDHPRPAGSEVPRASRGRLARVASVLGELLVTAGLVLLLFVVHQVYVTDVLADRRQETVADDLRSSWAATAPVAAELPVVPLATAPLGDGFAFLRIPRLGRDYVRAVVEGAGTDQLAQGPGHYPGTAMPGQPGNFAVAGHRVGTGSPFLDLDALRPGDAIVVETADAWYTYRVLGDAATGDVDADPSGIPGVRIVRPSDRAVIHPTPGAPADQPPTDSYLTLTTCHPRYSARQRLIVHARLEGTPLAKAGAPSGPPALSGE